jgi:hypothetical protein
MITVFNRKELIVTMSMDIQAKVRDVLATNNIDYSIKTKNLQASPWYANSRSRTGSFGINSDYSYEYKIFIRAEDYDIAQVLINQNR